MKVVLVSDGGEYTKNNQQKTSWMLIQTEKMKGRE